MSTRPAVLFFTFALLQGCSSSSPASSCDATSCGGCCDTSGVCQAGDKALACGASGGACSACGATGVCSAGQCGCTDTCEMGFSQCLDGGVSACARQSNGCLALSPPAACTSGQVCSGASCTGHCSDQCTAGQTRCAGNGIEICAVQAAGCLDWGAPQTCNDGSCMNGRCPGCTDTCTAGASQCDGSGNRQSCTLGASGCLAWATQACTGGDVCTQGACAPPCTVCPQGFSCTMGACAGGDPSQLVLDVPVVTVSGALTVNGAPPSVMTGCAPPAALITFTEKTTGATVTLQASCNAGLPFSGALIAGIYSVSVRGDDTNVNVPAQTYLANPSLDLTASKAGLTLDVPVVSVSGSVTVNGAAPSVLSGCAPPAALITLTETTSHSTVQLQSSCAAGLPFSGAVLGGHYDITVTGDDTNVNVPAQPYRAMSAVDLTSNRLGLVLDVPVVSVSGALTVNGAAPSVMSGCARPSALITLTDTSTQSTVTLQSDCTAGLPFSGAVLGGHYDVTIRGDDSNVNVPAQGYLAASGLDLTASKAGLAFDIPVVTLSGSLTVNGAAPAVMSGCAPPSALLMLTDTVSGSSVQLQASCNAGLPFSGSVLGGTYKVTVTGDDTNVNVPAQAYLASQGLVLTANKSGVVFDIPVVTVSGSLTVNGAAPSVQPGCAAPAALLTFVDTASGSSVTLQSSCNAGLPFSGSVLGGTYAVTVRGDDSHVNLPAQSYRAATALDLTSSKSGVAFDIPVFNVGGTITVNGAAPLVMSGCAPPAALVAFTDVATGASVSLQASCNAGLPFSGTVLGGTYKVTVTGDDTNVNVPAQPYVAVPLLRIGP